MQFTIYSFLFFSIVLLLFYTIRIEGRPYVLCLASILYPFTIDRNAGIAVLVFSLVVYFQSILIGKTKSGKRKWLIAFLSVCCVVAVWLFLKNVIWFNQVSISNQTENNLLRNVIIPIGFSFYAFQAVGYLLDLYWDKTELVMNPVLFYLYMAWFPRFISGPIMKASDFLKEIRKLYEVKLFEKDRIKVSCSYFLVGCFYKIMVADRLAPVVEKVFSGSNHYSRAILILASVLYTMQIYCDFAGYSMYVIGISNLFGIRLVENFRAPYLSKNIKEFWDRWHISLTKWFGEYLYIPLGGSRKGILRKYINIMIVFLVSGVWHGVGFSFIAWGMLHGIYNIINDIFHRVDKRRQEILEQRNAEIHPLILTDIIKKIGTWFLTFSSVSFAWIFFKSGSLSGAVRYIRQMFTNHCPDSFSQQLEKIGIMEYDYRVYVIMLLVVLGIDVIIDRIGLDKFVRKLPLVPWLIAVWLFVLGILVYGTYGPTVMTDMIYMSF